MSRFTLRLATVKGIPIYLHWSFWLLVLWVVLDSFFSPYFSGGVLVWRLLLLVGLVGSVILHELGHAMAALTYGIPTRDITMYPFGGVASLAHIPDKPLQELVIAMAGPLVNFLLIGLFQVVLWTIDMPLGAPPQALLYTGSDWPSLTIWLYSLSFMNGLLAVFNLLPAFPMDGGRILRALLATRLEYTRATQIAALVGQGFAVLFLILGFFYNPSLVLVGFFVYVAASQERAQVERRTLLGGFTVMDALMEEVPTLSVNHTIKDAVEALLRSQARSFVIVDPSGVPVGTLSREALIEALSEGRGREPPLLHIMDPHLLRLSPTTTLTEALRLLNEEDKPLAVVVEGDKLLGYIDAENIAEFLLLRKAAGTASS